MDNRISLQHAVKQLLEIVRRLHRTYPRKEFTLDGRLVGDIGEIIVASAYTVTLFDGMEKHHDGVASGGRPVQIKATMKGSLTIPARNVPEFYIGIKINGDGSFSEVFNGPGALVAVAVENRTPPANGLHSVSIRKLAKLNADVPAKGRIPLRRTSPLRPKPLA
jgi:hypothetical protein